MNVKLSTKRILTLTDSSQLSCIESPSSRNHSNRKKTVENEMAFAQGLYIQTCSSGSEYECAYNVDRIYLIPRPKAFNAITKTCFVSNLSWKPAQGESIIRDFCIFGRIYCAMFKFMYTGKETSCTRYSIGIYAHIKSVTLSTFMYWSFGVQKKSRFLSHTTVAVSTFCSL